LAFSVGVIRSDESAKPLTSESVVVVGGDWLGGVGFLSLLVESVHLRLDAGDRLVPAARHSAIPGQFIITRRASL
jgi:hypothetical protein